MLESEAKAKWCPMFQATPNNRWPGMWKAFENACRCWHDGLEQDLEKFKHQTFAEYLRAYLNGFE